MAEKTVLLRSPFNGQVIPLTVPPETITALLAGGFEIVEEKPRATTRKRDEE